jgi:uncharacterized protein (UPF0332 family)
MNTDKVNQRMEKSRQALDDAYFLLQDKRYLAAVNRMYYAAFYIVTAYFAYKDWVVKTHSGVKTKFHLELTAYSLISEDDSKTYNLLFLRRHEFDYDDFVTYSESDIISLYKSTKALIQRIKTLITINE